MFREGRRGVLDGGDGEFWLGLVVNGGSVSDKGGSVSVDGGVGFVSLGVSVTVDVEGMLWINGMSFSVSFCVS